MTKVLSATCSAGIVSVDGIPVSTAVNLGEGIGASNGVLILEEGNIHYLPKASPDLKATLEDLSSAIDTIVDSLTTISNALTAIGAGMTGASTAPPPTLSTSVGAITSDISTLIVLKGQIDLLKDTLI